MAKGGCGGTSVPILAFVINGFRECRRNLESDGLGRSLVLCIARVTLRSRLAMFMDYCSTSTDIRRRTSSGWAIRGFVQVVIMVCAQRMLKSCKGQNASCFAGGGYAGRGEQSHALDVTGIWTLNFQCTFGLLIYMLLRGPWSVTVGITALAWGILLGSQVLK